MSSCTNPIIAATSQFGPGASSSSTPSAGTINAALNSICSTAANSCTDQTFRSKLADFYSACTAELTTNVNSDVIRTYDVLYALTPLKQAICTKDDSGKYCVTEITAPSSSTGASDSKVDIAVGSSSTPDLSSVKQWLWSTPSNAKRATGETAAIIPNVTTYKQSNLLFFFLQPQMDSATLCTTCTRNVLMAYFNFERSVPYGPGLSNSPLMGGQSALYNAVNSTCGKSFFGGAVQAAGGISDGLLGNAAPRSVSQSLGGIITAVMGTVAFGFAAIL